MKMNRFEDREGVCLMCSHLPWFAICWWLAEVEQKNQVRSTPILETATLAICDFFCHTSDDYNSENSGCSHKAVPTVAQFATSCMLCEQASCMLYDQASCVPCMQALNMIYANLLHMFCVQTCSVCMPCACSVCKPLACSFCKPLACSVCKPPACSV